MINFLLATQRVESTIGVTLNRLVRYFKYAGAYLAATALGTGAGYAMGSFVGSPELPGLIGALAGFGLCGYFLHWLRRARLYHYWAPHLVLFGKLADDQMIPTGKQQLELGREEIKQLFETPQELFELHENSSEVLRCLFIQKFNLEAMTSIPLIVEGLKFGFNLVLSPLRDSLLILSLTSDIQNPWLTMKHNVELVASTIGSVLRNLLMVTVMQIIGCLLAFTVWYVGVDWLTDHWPEVNLLGWKLLITGLLAWIMYAVFVYPIAVNAMLDELLKLKKPEQQVTIESDQLASVAAYNNIVERAQAYTVAMQSNVERSATETEN